MAERLALAFRPWVAPYLGAATIAFAMAALIVARGRGPVRRPFVGLLTAVGLSLTATGCVFLADDGATATWLVRASQAVVSFAAPSAVELTRALTGGRLRRLRLVAWVAAIAVAALAFSPLVIAHARPFAWGWAGVAGPLYPLAVAEMTLALAMPVTLALHLRKEMRPLARRQQRMVLGAAVLAGLAFVDTLPVVGIDAPPLGWLPLTSSALVLLAAIVRDRLVDVRLALRRSLLWFVFTSIGALPFVGAAALLAMRVGRAGAVELAVFYGLLGLTMRAYLGWVQPQLDLMVGRRRRDIDVELAVLADQAATLQTSEELGRAIDRFLAALDRRLAALVVIDEKGRPRVVRSAWGSVPAPSRGSPLLAELARERRLIARDQAEGPARLEIERACVRWGAEYLGPLVDGEQLLGLIAVSPRQGGGQSDAVELEALDRMCVTVTSALAGARLYERLHALSNELEQKAAARSESLAKALRDLRGAEQRLVESEKLASLGQIVAGVAADLSDQVRAAFDRVPALRRDAELLFAAADRVRAHSGSRDERWDDMHRDLGPLLDALTEGARRAHAIAEDLEGFAVADGEAPARVARVPHHLAALIDSTLTLVTGHLADVAIVRDYDETLPPIPVEPGPLGQVILNLVLNATQAMRGSGTLTLSTRRTESHAELAVADTGPGIPPDVLPRIFEPFFSTKGPTTGTGLGLSISYGIVKRHGGRIAVESTPDVGTTFRVLLPLP